MSVAITKLIAFLYHGYMLYITVSDFTKFTIICARKVVDTFLREKGEGTPKLILLFIL